LKNRIEELNPDSIYGKIGLNNIGATCYMNASLQCFSQTKDLTKYFLNDNNKPLFNAQHCKLSPYYAKLIKELWNINGKKFFEPNEFSDKIQQLNTLFKKGMANDSKDLILFIIQQIHLDLIQPNTNIQEDNSENNQYDKVQTLNKFVNENMRKGESIISNVFYGVNESITLCKSCQFKYNSMNMKAPLLYNYETFNMINFPLEEVRLFRNNRDIQNNIDTPENSPINLYDCFQFARRSQLSTGDNQNYCNLCQQLSDAQQQTRIYQGPNYLILILNRGKNNCYNVDLELFETLDLTEFIIKKDKPQMIYDLYGVITLKGESGENAHFIAFCKNWNDNKWYKYNDAFVDPIKDFKKEVVGFGVHYVLFFQKR
jgi:ubiquitin C-terminal hydrolase